VNGLDDDLDGYADNGWDGIDNNLPFEIANGLPHLTDDPLEWEAETWLGPLATLPPLPSTFAPPLRGTPGITNQQYIITRRPITTPGSRETNFPSSVVLDLTTWDTQTFNAQAQADGFSTTFVSERSRLPVDPNTGYVDILIDPRGQVVPTTKYSTPSSFSMGSSFYHFWLSERTDLFPPAYQKGGGTLAPYLLPMPAGTPNYPSVADSSGRQLTGEWRLLTLFTRTGQLSTNAIGSFDGTAPSLPFLSAQQGGTGDIK
jgi:hypothetical protein